MKDTVVTRLRAGFEALQEKKAWRRVLMLLLAALAVLSLVLSFAVGYYQLSPTEIVRTLFSRDPQSPEYSVLMRVRIPRVLSAFVVGAALSVSGGAYQGMFRNPLVSPDILGVASGAGLGASIAIFLHFSTAGTQFLAFVFGLAASFAAYGVSMRARFGHTVSLVLAGTMIGALCTAATSMLKYVASPEDTLAAITFWLMGTLAKTTWSSFLFSLPAFAAGFILIYLLRWRLNVLTLPDEEALSVGINPRRSRVLAILAATLLCAGAVCLSGLVGWVGLMVPHIARGLTGPQFRKMLPASFLLGGIFLVLVDDIARSVSAAEIPLGVLTAFMGAPFFLVLLLRARRTESAL